MNVVILETSGCYKLKQDKQREINKAIDKLSYLIKAMGDFSSFVINNPAIHDAYEDFYVYKYTGMKCSIRLLYRYSNGKLEIHLCHFKKGDRDNSKYIEVFEEYANNYYRR